MQVKTKIIESLFIKALRWECTFISSTGNLKSNIDNFFSYKCCFWVTNRIISSFKIKNEYFFQVILILLDIL